MTWRLLSDSGEGNSFLPVSLGGVARANDSLTLGYGDEFPPFLKSNGSPGAPPSNSLFYRLDQGVLYRYDSLSTWTGLAPGGSMVLYPSTSDGSRDDWPRIQAALSAATNGSTIVLKPGIYNTRSAPLTLTGKNGVRIIGEGLPTIKYRSAFASNPTAQTDRAGIYALTCADLIIEGIGWEGDQEPDIDLNIGPAVYMRECARPTLRGLRLTYGAGLFQQDPTATDKGLLVTGCYSYGHRYICVPGSYSVIENSQWELPADASYDRIGDLGSSHAIYLFAGRHYVTVDNCEFTNIRTTGVKASGTSAPISNLHVTNCRFIECGNGVLFGADGALDAVHSDFLVENSVFTDCANKAAGWNGGTPIAIISSIGSVVRGNKITYSRAAVTAASAFGIDCGIGARVTEDPIIEGNQIIARAPGVSPGDVINRGINLANCARPRVERNWIDSCGAAAIFVTTPACTEVEVSDNHFRNVVTTVQATSAAGIEVSRCRFIRGADSSGGAQLRFTSCTGIESVDNEEFDSTGFTPLVESIV